MKYLFLLTLLLIADFISGQNNENYIWNYNSLSGNISKKTQIVFAEKLHYNIGDRQLDYKQADVIIYQQIHKKIKVGIALRNAYSGGKENWVSEITPQLYGVYDNQIKRINIQWSNRFDYRNFETGIQQTRYRNKLTVAMPSGFTSLDIRPYLAEEAFIKLDQDGLYNFRLFGGIYAFNKHSLKVNLFYCYNMIDYGEKWGHQNVAGLYLNFNI